MSKRVIVLGATGMLGSMVCKTLDSFYQVIPISGREYDFRNPNEVERFCAMSDGRNKDNIVVNCCGMLRQRLPKHPSQQDVYDTIMLNGYLPRKIFQHYYGIHIATDCVYSGTKGGYHELDHPDEKDLYGMSKSMGDDNCGFTIRTSIIGPEINRKLSLFEWFMSQQNAVNGFNNHLWNGMTTKTLARCILEVITKEKYLTAPKLYHLYSNIVSKYELLLMFNKLRDNKIDIADKADGKIVDRTLSTIHPEFLSEMQNYIPYLEQQIAEIY